MIRRRYRPRHEIAFGFDSFLDIVANVVGIIIRLILVVWVGARSYHMVQHLPKPPPQPDVQLPALDDPLRAELAERRRELEALQSRLVHQLRQLETAQRQRAEAEAEQQALASRRQVLRREQAALEQAAAERDRQAQALAQTIAELRQRSDQLADALRDLEKQPPAKLVLRYHTPVSRPVTTEEVMFECQSGRVSFVDVATLLAEVRRQLPEKEQLLRTQWQVSDVAGPVGAFRLRYTVERQRGLLDSGVVPDSNRDFRYGLSSWQVEPVTLARGETADQALADRSEFRHVIDSLASPNAVVTLWVYPDSFALYRRLRDYLHERDLIVAGRPLPEGALIASSPRGTVSRGQ